MKIRLITFHTPKNYGAVLQAYSLMSFLKTIAPDVKVIDFNTPHLQNAYPLKVHSSGLKGNIKAALDNSFLPQKKMKYRKFDDFVDNKLDLTERFDSFERLRNTPPDADVYVTGSDQVFGPNRVEEERNAFYLNFGDESIQRIAYAASFGVKDVPEDRKQEIGSYLRRFDKIAVREKSGMRIVEQLSGKTAVEVLDPVFLNDVAFWKHTSVAYPIGNEPYLLYYRLMSDRRSDENVRKIAAEKGLKLVVVMDGFLMWKADRVLRDVGPQELLYLIDHAEFVATDSFHGVAFSLIFEKQFFFCDYQENLAERALNLMKIAGTERCAGLNGGTGREILEYADINKKLSVQIEASKMYLKNTLCE